MATKELGIERAGAAGAGAGAKPPIEYRPPYRWAALAGLGIFLLYVFTLAPTTAFWDTSEYIATGHILGIPHPPGNPVFVLLARAWELLLFWLPVSTAVKTNLFSAANGAAAAAFWFLVAHRVLSFFSEDEMFRRIGALGAMVLSATAFTVWNQSVVNEKVYPVTLMTVALLTFLIFRWRDNLGRGKDDNLLLLIVFILALSVGNHLMAFLAAPALGLFIILVHPRALLRWQLYAFASLAWALGLSAQLFLPIRAESRPVIAEADPRCESIVQATVDILSLGRTERCAALASSLRREQYRKPSIMSNPIFAPRDVPRDGHLTRWQFINYSQYFDWQWARSLAGSDTFLAVARAPFTILFLFLGLAGAWRHFFRDRISWAYFATLFVTMWFGLIIYLNFKYGYSVEATTVMGGQEVPVPRDWREVRERDYFYIVSFSLWGAWAGIGLAAIWQMLTRLATKAKGALSFADYRRLAPIMLLALLPMILNWKYASRAGDYAARDWAHNILNSVEPYGVLFTNGDNDTFPLWYLQEVEGLRRDVTVIVYSYLATPWYASQLRDLSAPCGDRDPTTDPTVIICQRAFEPDKAIDLYSDEEWRASIRPESAIELFSGDDWRAPSRSILELNDAQLDATPDCFPRDERGFCAGFPDSVTIPFGDAVALVERGRNLVRNDLLILNILQATAGDRPVYFASTTGVYEKFNLQPYMVRQGVAYKLMPREVTAEDGYMLFPAQARGRGSRQLPYWVDTERTERLLEDHFVYRDLPDWEFWPDLSTNGIPLQYYEAFASVATGYLVQNEPEKADEIFRKAVKFAEVTFGQDLDVPSIVPSAATGPSDTVSSN